MTTFIEIPRDGNVPKLVEHHPLTDEVCRMMTASYAATGYVEPWVGYLIEVEGKNVGTCAFKGPPIDGKVEIAYFTYPDFERQGIGRLAAAKLVDLALRTDPSLQVVAQTLPHENASTSILKSLGFILQGAIEHPEDGTVWDWALESSGSCEAQVDLRGVL
jgi:[ribosomal protein S5]-alanine N-acetyltransferase